MTENTEKEAVSFTIKDLIDIVNIIDFAASKGIFVGVDMEFVGVRRNKLQAFIEQNTPKEEEVVENTETQKTEEVSEQKPKKTPRKKSVEKTTK